MGVWGNSSEVETAHHAIASSLSLTELGRKWTLFMISCKCVHAACACTLFTISWLHNRRDASSARIYPSLPARRPHA